MKNWVLKGCKDDLAALSNELKINPLLIKIMLNREIEKDKMKSLFENEICNINSYSNLSDIIKAIRIIKKHIDERKKIRIVGDYDADGICSTSILYLGLKELGANVDYSVPNREKDGYGINENIVKKAYEDGIDLIITCDNGIAAFEAMNYAKNELGMNIIITDHHNIPIENNIPRLPVADAIVNPKLGDYPFQSICGAFVAYKLIEAIHNEYNIDFINKKDLMILAGVATVCDIMPLLDENRILVKYVIDNIKDTKIIGLKKLIEKSGIKYENIGVYSFGFIIGPILNSSGRLEDASLGIELLITSDESRATEIAEKLKELNYKRQLLTNEAVDKSEDYITNNKLYKDKVMCLLLEGVHHSIAGIVAGRILNKYYKPVLVFIPNEEGKIVGSGRSIEEYDLFSELSAIKELFIKFGGHRQAAGFTAEYDKFSEINKRLNDNCKLKDDLLPTIYIDAILEFRYINVELIRLISGLEPFGEKYPIPKFATQNIKINRYYRIGSEKQYLRLELKQGDNILTGLVFNNVDKMDEILDSNKNIDIVYTLQINEWNGITTPQLLIEDFRCANN